MQEDNNRVVIIGGGIAGRNVARELLRLGKSSGITVIKKENHGSYSPCGLPYVLSGEIESMGNIIFPKLDDKMRKNDVRVMDGAEVKEIGLTSKSVILSNGDSLPYDKLVIATGRKPFLPDLQGIDEKGVYTLSNYEDGLRIYEELGKAKKAVVVGAGLIGCEMASAFLKRGLETTLVEIKSHILPKILDESMASIVHKRLEDLGVRIITGRAISRIGGRGRVESVSVDGDEHPVPGDLVLIAAGFIPEAAVAGEAGFEIGRLGGLITDRFQHLKAGGAFAESVYGCGDCVEVKNRLTGKNSLNLLTETAIVQARIIALDILGKSELLQQTEDEGHVPLALTCAGGLQIGMAGLTTNGARLVGIHPRSIQTRGWAKEVYFPGNKRIDIKLLVDEDRLIGAQVVGEEEVKGKLNEISALIYSGVSLQDILCRQRCYTPPLSASPDALIRALEKITA
jgi:NADH oxidase (H2O2-forming)